MKKATQRFALILLGFCCLLLFTGRVWSEEPEANAARKHFAEENHIRSIDGNVATTIKFVNKSKQLIKVYWLDYEGEGKFYAAVKDGGSHELKTYLTHPWLITDANENAWYVYFPDAQPRTVKIVSPKKNEPATISGSPNP